VILTPENYYSPEANFEYMSVSQFKDFSGTYGQVGCEARAMAKLRGEYQEEKTTALLVGSYVDSYFEGAKSLERFKSENPEIFTQKGELRAEYKKADAIIQRIESDEYFMQCMSGEKQVIMTAEIFGIPWKIKIDSYVKDIVITDLKIVESIKKMKWVRDLGYLDFIRFWGYDTQGAIYQEAVRQNTGKRLPFYIAAASKEPTTDIEVIHVQENFLREAMHTVQYHIDRIKQVKSGKVEPERCGVCDYCLKTKKLRHPIGILDLTAGI
jgi:hypothetical protein